MLHCRDDTGRVMSSVWLLLDMILGIQAKEFIYYFYFLIKAENFVSGSLRDLQALFDTLRMGCCGTFIKEWLLFGHFTIEAWFVECYRNCCPSWRFSSLQRSNTGALSEQPSISWSPPWIRPFYPDCSRKSPGGYKLFGTINTPEIFLPPSPDLCLYIFLSQRSADNSLDLMVWFVLWHARSNMGSCRDRCVPFQITSNQLHFT